MYQLTYQCNYNNCSTLVHCVACNTIVDVNFAVKFLLCLNTVHETINLIFTCNLQNKLGFMKITVVLW